MTYETHDDVSSHIAERDVDVYLVDRAVVASRLRFCWTSSIGFWSSTAILPPTSC